MIIILIAKILDRCYDFYFVIEIDTLEHHIIEEPSELEVGEYYEISDELIQFEGTSEKRWIELKDEILNN